MSAERLACETSPWATVLRLVCPQSSPTWLARKRKAHTTRGKRSKQEVRKGLSKHIEQCYSAEDMRNQVLFICFPFLKSTYKCLAPWAGHTSVCGQGCRKVERSDSLKYLTIYVPGEAPVDNNFGTIFALGGIQWRSCL